MAKLAILFLAVCVALGHGTPVPRSTDDVRDYIEFLRNSVNGAPTSPIPGQEVPEWMRSGKFEGDIILSEPQIEGLVAEYLGSKNAITNPYGLWPGRVVTYAIQYGDFNEGEIHAIRHAIYEMEMHSCVRFNERTDQPAYILVTGRHDGCYAAVGYVGSPGQTLNLGPGCIHNGIIIHEFLHSLGFFHMQSTYNRDYYVEILWHNIIHGFEHAFDRYGSDQVTNLGEEYDYGSVLHYSLYGFSSNGQRTIQPLRDTGDIEIGQIRGMSDGDIRRLNRLYGCWGN